MHVGKTGSYTNIGIYAISDIPEGFRLNHRQELQVKGIKNNAEYIDKQKIAGFIGQIVGPLFFLILKPLIVLFLIERALLNKCPFSIPFTLRIM